MIRILYLSLSLSFIFPFIGDSSDPIRTIGDIGQIASPIYGLYLTYENSDNVGRVQFYKSTVATILTTHFLKQTIDKLRPDRSDNNSFPSGHTSAAFSGVTFIHKRYGLNKAWPIYIVASFVGYSRVYAEKHYWEDVFAGAILAGINSWIFTSPLLENADASIQHKQITLQLRS